MDLNEAFLLLGVSRTSNLTEVKKAYREKSHAVHPDRGGSAEQFLQLNKAYSVVKDELKPRKVSLLAYSGIPFEFQVKEVVV